ncbi:FIG002776: hypothetical protein [hydrothermal vent metagenome]|uniref:JmjC domain-containing protein n=1 Tax=hydrothermal vent metagenome TaxID=652676 RepID=A0A3B1BES7_9ZZZZ
MTKHSPLLGGLSPARFLADYWQKQPLRVKNALPDFTSPISPDELAGLACEDEVESRIVLERDGPQPWALRIGPFDDEHFAHLPETHWTLLVQECNKYLPELITLLEQFNFIPNWRIDDIMVSYAPEHGSVGPHMDQYDVFLIQGLGHRRWQISTDPVAADNVIPDLDLRIMRDFQATDEWVLEPGDMLYLPPGVAHYGVALDDCMTFSVGFRTPTVSELLTGFLDEIASELNDHQRYHDPDLPLQTHPGEITAGARARIRRIIRSTMADDAAIDQWFGRYITESKSGQTATPPAQPLSTDEFLQQLHAAGALWRSEYARFSFIDDAADEITLFIDGQTWPLPRALAKHVTRLCDQRQITNDEFGKALHDEPFTRLLTQLYNAGYIEFPQSAEK